VRASLRDVREAAHTHGRKTVHAEAAPLHGARDITTAGSRCLRTVVRFRFRYGSTGRVFANRA
jgi:hypothetical protein